MQERLNKIYNFFNKELWQMDTAPMPLLQRYGIGLFRVSYVLIHELATGMLNLRAMSLVYTTLLSLVPLIAVSFSVLKGFGVHNQVEPLLQNFVAPLGPNGIEIVDKILLFVENMKVGVLGAVGLALLLYTVISLIQKIESAFNYVWHTEGKRSLARRFSDYLSVIMIGPVLVFSAIGITASIMNHSIMQTIVAIEPFGSLIIFLSKMVPYLFVIAAFTFIYMFVPNTRVQFKSALVGAVVGGILWQTSGVIFASFMAGSTKYAAIYSGFAILILFMIWLYLSWLILLFGAHVAYLHQHPDQIRPERKRMELSAYHREYLVLTLMSLIASHYYRDEPRWTSESLAEHLAIPHDILFELLDLLTQSNLIVETNDTPPTYVPAHDPASLTLDSILALIHHYGEQNYLLKEQALQHSPVQQLFKEMDGSFKTSLAGKTLKDLIE
ncbi:MAG: YihY/virulence factor BrkB family protein [Gammaproteobacteria bacterium]|nr:YihY/virulence factor BrkB family protein [Gammaproteobacteria bacterium]